MKDAKASGTVVDSYLACPNPDCGQRTPISDIRGDRGGEYGLRMWENDDIVPKPDDVFQERLYCIRWVETFLDDDGKVQTRRHYMAPDRHDLKRENKVLELLRERFKEWQAKGFIPNRKIEPGAKTDEPIRTRGWTHWHHLFNPRQLLVNGLFLNKLEENKNLKYFQWAVLLINIANAADYNSRLSRVHSAADNEGIVENVPVTCEN